MSFRDRHRFLDAVYNAYPDPESISAKKLESISQKAGLLMEEVLSWFEDEKLRRSKLLGTGFQPRLGLRSPPSPMSMSGSGPNGTVTMNILTENTIQTATLDFQGTSSPPALPKDRPSVSKERHCRRAKRHSSTNSDSTSAKRQKISEKYPCPDCGKDVPVKGYSEHVKRVHFPDHVWECPKISGKTGERCGANPCYRLDNFVTHLKGEHDCSDTEVNNLKIKCKFRVVNFFHSNCGVQNCDTTFTSRDESIEHIKDHCRKNSQKQDPAMDLIASWEDKCGAPHKLQRGIHYRNEEDAGLDGLDGGHDHDHGGGPSQGDSQDRGPQDSHGDKPHSDGNGGSSGNAGSSTNQNFGQTGNISFSLHQSLNLAMDKSSEDSALDSSFGLEGLCLPFRSIRILGSGGHGSVDEVVSSTRKETFARKTVIRKRNEHSSSQMGHLKNELAVLKDLNHPHLVKLIGAYTDANHSHIIMTPVADQSLADHMRCTQSSAPDVYLQWMGCLASALAYLHKRQIQHLDIKPQNILVHGSNILLADFGTSKSFVNDNLFDAEKLALTPMYTAPETIEYGTQDYPTDIFSLGCVFAEMASLYYGRSVEEFEEFRSAAGQKSFYATLDKAKIWLAQLHENSHSTALSILIMTEKMAIMMSKDPHMRPVSSNVKSFFANSAQNSCMACKEPSQSTEVGGEQLWKINSGSAAPTHEPTENSKQSPPSSPRNMNEALRKLFSPELDGKLSYSGASAIESEGAMVSVTDLPYTSSASRLAHEDHMPRFPQTLKPSTICFNDPPGRTRFDESESSIGSSDGSVFSYDSALYREYPHPMSRSTISMTPDVQSPFQNLQYISDPDLPPWRPSISSHRPHSDLEDFSSEVSKEKGRCTYPECGKIFKDLKAHMLTHMIQRPEKCPIQTCDYHIKGFARKYDKNRHILTHYKGTMVCGFCPGDNSASRKSFNRADVFKRHLTAVHAVEQAPPNCRKKTNINRSTNLSDNTPGATGECSTCSIIFSNAQDFYDHLDDCVLRIVQQEDPSEAINAARLAEVEQDRAVHETLRRNVLPTTTTIVYPEEEEDDENDVDFSLRLKSSSKGRGNGQRNPANGVQKSRGLTHSKGGVTLNSKGRKKRKDYPSSWGCPTTQMKMKKRVLCVFDSDGPRRLWKDDMMLDTDYEGRIKLIGNKSYVTGLDVTTMRRADAFHHANEAEKGPWIADDLTGVDPENVMAVKT